MLKLSIHLLISFHNLQSLFIVLFYNISFFSICFTLSFLQNVWKMREFFPRRRWERATSFPCGHYYALITQNAVDAKKRESYVYAECSSALTHSLSSAATLFCVSLSLSLSFILYLSLSLFFRPFSIWISFYIVKSCFHENVYNSHCRKWRIKRIQNPFLENGHFHSSNPQKWLPYQILGGKTVNNVQIWSTKPNVTLWVSEFVTSI